MDSLENKRVLVVGGSSGIGLAIAKAAAEAGARVCVAARDAEKLRSAAKAIGHGAEARPLDTSEDAAVAAFFAAGETWDHVVASTGAGGRGLVADIDMKTAYAAMDGKFWSYYRVARAARMAPNGSITFITGGIGWRPWDQTALISAVNAAIEGLMRGLAHDLGPVRVNSVCPGPIDTPMWDRMSTEARAAMYAHNAATLPARRMGEPGDVAQVVLMAMTNPFVTGATLVVDGGGLVM